jgi:hypothetical protein
MEENCFFCKKLSDADSIIHAETTGEASACATKVAKERADKERIKGVSWVDLYMMYYRAAFEHEYRRRITLKTEETMNRLLETCPANERVCGYHSENVAWYNGTDSTVDHEECQKEVRTQFRQSKWPNPLLYNEGGRIGPV